MPETRITMKNLELIETLSEFKEGKNIDRATMLKVLEEVFRAMIRKKYGTDENCDIILNDQNGDMEIWRTRQVVDDNSEDIWDFDKIMLSEAHKFDPSLEEGDDLVEEIKIIDFGRRAILAARQTLVSKIMELEKDTIIRKYRDRVGEIVTGEVYQVWRKEVLLFDTVDIKTEQKTELILPKEEQIHSDFYAKGNAVKAIIKKVDIINGTPRIIISRTDPSFLAKLMEQEVPEIFDGLITIKNIVREPGERAKVAVETFDDRIDPVGACVGVKGSRIHSIVKELRNESIDVINYTNNIQLYITRALSPAKISSIQVDTNRKTASVYLKPDQVSLAIGKGGHNIKLAAKLTGFEIDVFRELDNDDEDDIDIDEFADEIETWILDELKAIGCDTAKSVLKLGEEGIVKRTSLEEETARDIIRIITAEFE